jgi:hypothetical protein
VLILTRFRHRELRRRRHRGLNQEVAKAGLMVTLLWVVALWWDPSDGGGGDTCNGKMIESYRVDITALEEYKTYIQPILNKLTVNDEKGESSPFDLSANLKNWYLIDCKLQDLPRERKGLYLETYQTAIHTSREIFIDSKSYNKMSPEEKSKLLLHEMIMGLLFNKIFDCKRGLSVK